MSNNYTDPNVNVRREFCAQTSAGNGAVSARFAHFQKTRLKAVHCQVVTAGTSAGAGNSVIIKKGTTALGTFTLGSNTAGYIATPLKPNVEVDPNEVISATNGTDATGVALLTYEYEVTIDAVKS